MSKELAARLQVALTGGLVIDHPHCTIEGAISHVAAVQLRAIRFALLCDDPNDQRLADGRGWCSDDRFTSQDAAAAIGGVMALLQEAHDLASEIREALDEDESEAKEERRDG